MNLQALSLHQFKVSHQLRKVSENNYKQFIFLLIGRLIHLSKNFS